MSNRRRLALMSLVLATVAALSAGTGVAVVYNAAFEFERKRILVVIEEQSRLFDLVVRFDTERSSADGGDNASVAALRRFRDAQSRWSGFGRSSERYLVKKSGDLLEYVSKPRLYSDSMPLTVPLTDSLDVAALRALDGAQGAAVMSDYRGVKVLAGYGPIDASGIGVVVKVDMSEFRDPYIRAGLVVAVAALILIVVGLSLTREISEPVVAELQEKHRLEFELEFARQIQQASLADVPQFLSGYEFAARSVPARYVGGDFYDFKVLYEGIAAVIIGDVSGKGVSAALHVPGLISDFRSASDINASPAAILQTLNKQLSESARNGTFVSAVCLLIDCNRHIMSVANAGHQSPLLRSCDGDVEEIAGPSGPPLGVLADGDYKEITAEINDGQLVLLYTDGITETRGTRRENYGLSRLKRLLAEQPAGPHKILDAVENEIASFAGDMPKFDDLTLLAFARRVE